MRRILVLGAGHSSPFLIRYLLEHAAELDASITVADLDADAAGRRVGEHERGRARQLDLRDRAATAELMAEHDLAINLLPPQLQPTVARLCVDHGCHMVSASYRSREIEDLSAEAEQRGLALLTEMGLDPGIDLMSAQQIIEEVQARGGVIERFLSYGGGLPEPSFDGNPLRYCVTWNPRNVVMAGEHGARYLKNGRFKLEPWHRVFNLTWPVEVPGVGTMDAYANRDSISYRAIHGIERVKTLVRGTLRYPGFCQAWNQLVQLGMPNEFLEIPRLGERTWAELTAMFLPARAGSAGPPGSEEVAQRAADALGLERQDPRLQTLEWLGIFSEEPIGIAGEHPAEALTDLLQRRLPLPPTARDLVVLHHEIEARFEGGASPGRERILSTFVHHGEPGGLTAMATTVGLPAALGARMLLDGRLERRGCLSPTDADVYRPVLAALRAEGLGFDETITRL